MNADIDNAPTTVNELPRGNEYGNENVEENEQIEQRIKSFWSFKHAMMQGIEQYLHRGSESESHYRPEGCELSLHGTGVTGRYRARNLLTALNRTDYRDEKRLLLLAAAVFLGSALGRSQTLASHIAQLMITGVYTIETSLQGSDLRDDLKSDVFSEAAVTAAKRNSHHHDCRGSECGTSSSLIIRKAVRSIIEAHIDARRASDPDNYRSFNAEAAIWRNQLTQEPPERGTGANVVVVVVGGAMQMSALSHRSRRPGQ